MREALKIVSLCIVAAVVYGILHDQITARVCIEYFTLFHPPIFATKSPALLALGWGIVATWWVGLFLGLLLALAARAGSRPRLSASALLRPFFILLAIMACCAFVAGVTGFIAARLGLFGQAELNPPLDQSTYPRFTADWFAHTASYASGIFGGLGLCIFQYRRRGSLGKIE